jgi:hypothetical protein
VLIVNATVCVNFRSIIVFVDYIPGRPALGVLELVSLYERMRGFLFITKLHRGVFLCIRCSGIHRGMGTHISRIKSVDLDMWTAEQMDVGVSCFILCSPD